MVPFDRLKILSMTIPVHWIPWQAKVRLAELSGEVRRLKCEQARMASEAGEAAAKIQKLEAAAAGHVQAVEQHSANSLRSQKGVAALINWIRSAHRLDPPAPGSIRAELVRSQQP